MPRPNRSEIGANIPIVIKNPNCPSLPREVTFKCPLNPNRKIVATLVNFEFDTPNTGRYSVRCECDDLPTNPIIEIKDQSTEVKTTAYIVARIFVQNVETDCGHPISHLN